LEERIEELSVKLELLHSEKSFPSTEGTLLTEERQTIDQKTSLERCLSICLKLIDHIQVVGSAVWLDSKEETTGSTKDASMSVPRMTNDALDACTQSLSNTAQHIRDIADEDQSKVEMDEAELIRQLGGTQRCLEILKKSERDRVNIFEKIDQSEDSRTMIVSTIGDLIRGTDIKVGARAISVMGQMSNESLQSGVEKFTSSLQIRSDSSAADRSNCVFMQRHGSGRTM
jgi:hypothetical protein